MKVKIRIIPENCVACNDNMAHSWLLTFAPVHKITAHQMTDMGTKRWRSI